MDNPVTHAELNEMEKRLDAENGRQNHRLSTLEETVKQIHSLTASVEKLALGVQNTVDELKKHSARLETLESRDGAMWRTVKTHMVTAVITAVITAAVTLAFTKFVLA